MELWMMRHCTVLLLFIFTAPLWSCTLTSPDKDPFIYVNTWRKKSGLHPLKANPKLKQAALNHSRYMIENVSPGHSERTYRKGFTGKDVSERAVFAGYPHRQTSENISVTPDALMGVESLMSAIYHRLGFLNPLIDEMGVGSIKSGANLFVTYVMGNSLLSRLCQNDSGSKEQRFFTRLCKERSGHIGLQAKKKADALLLGTTPDYIIYPYRGAKAVPPVFYEEVPDPLPEHFMVGNPISISFHPKFSGQKITILYARLWDAIRHKAVELIPLDAANDPYAKLTQQDFVFFPKKRLSWNGIYEMRLDYRIGSKAFSRQLTWNFHTKTMPNLIRYEGGTKRVPVKAGTLYTLYFASKEGDTKNAELSRARFRYNFFEGSRVKARVVDSLTVQICLQGKKGDRFSVVNEATGESIELLLD